MANFPASLDSLANPGAGTYTDDAGFQLDVVVSTIHDILEALEVKAGTGASVPTTGGDVLYVTGAGATAYGPKAKVALNEVVVTTPIAVCTFSGIPQTYRHLALEVYARGSVAAASMNLLLTFNADTGANYDSQQFYGSAATSSASEALAGTSILAYQVPAASAPANVFSGGVFGVLHYRNSASQKAVVGTHALKLSTSSGGIYMINTAGFWRSNAAITSITLTPSSGNIDTGSVLSLYGEP